MIYAGIDEAGYGPLFGPLVVARTVFSLDRSRYAEPFPQLWRILKNAVCRSPSDVKRRIAVEDSKRLYSPATGLGQLERSVLAFHALTGPVPVLLGTLLQDMTGLDPATFMRREWYRDETGGPALPVCADAAELTRAGQRVGRAAQATGTRLEETAAQVVLEDRFNDMLMQTGSKGALAWVLVSEHLDRIWKRYGHRSPRVVIDRQGGRVRYGELLQELFAGASVTVQEETPPKSRYRIQDKVRSMDVLVEVGSESRHLPVALASMNAKYLRELCLMRFHSFWRDKAPHVRPSFGYFRDGRRFLNEVQDLMREMGIDPVHMVRRR